MYARKHIENILLEIRRCLGENEIMGGAIREVTGTIYAPTGD
jgi:hypothetical protein